VQRPEPNVRIVCEGSEISAVQSVLWKNLCIHIAGTPSKRAVKKHWVFPNPNERDPEMATSRSCWWIPSKISNRLDRCGVQESSLKRNETRAAQDLNVKAKATENEMTIKHSLSFTWIHRTKHTFFRHRCGTTGVGSEGRKNKTDDATKKFP
jgi:hypothetical protein